jgi:hypothetical protein
MNELTFVRADGVWLCGKLKRDPAERDVKLLKPRVLQAVPDGNNQVRVSFLVMVGDPESVTVGSFAFMHQSTDQGLIGAYILAVTGLTRLGRYRLRTCR